MIAARRRALIVATALAVVVGACGGSETPTTTPDGTDGSTPVTSPTAAPPETLQPGSGEPTTGPSDPPSIGPTEAPPTDAPTSSPDPAAAACSGTAANRDFFASVATAVDWAVLCPVLPDGWFVEGGQYRLAGGGWLEIAYEGPDGERLAVRQGAPCDAAGCLPSGTELGAADYGDLSGTLLDLGNGRYAVVVDPGQDPSWTVVTDGLAEADVRLIAAAFTEVNPG